jgi:hypothetical protein
VRFSDEKDMLGVTGRREIGRVVDNEWKGLARGMSERMGKEL